MRPKKRCIATRASEFHAVSTAADTPVSESPAVNAPRLPHTRILSVKPQPTSLVIAIAEEPIQRSDPPLAPQENAPQEGALQVDGSKPTDAVAAPSPAAAKPIEQGNAPWIPQESGPQEGALQVDGSKPTAASSPAPATFRVAAAGADSTPPDAGAEALDDGGRIAERSTPTATRLGRCFAALGKTRTVASMSGSAHHARSASALANARLRSGPPLPSCATPISHTQSNLFRHLLPRGIAMLYGSGRGQRPPHFNRLREKDRSSLHGTC
jgi:hypothetical protein